MTYDEVPELHFIAPIENLPSIFEHGILSHRAARQIAGVQSVAKASVQERRAQVRVPGGRPLHDYVNLYFHARNPMLYLRKGIHQELCILSVRREVLNEPSVVVTDQNAASPYVRFASGIEGLRIVDREMVYADDWRHQDQRQYFRHRSAKCAEALIPDCVVPEYVRGAYVSCEEARARVHAVAPPSFMLRVRPLLFFR